MKKLLSSLFALSILATQAQVAKKVVVEHFTNTQCSTCAARNPDFYNNLNNQGGFVYLAIHPSSPYPSCQLNQHNVAENDARTNFYGIYGSTPRLVIQGSVISTAADYSSPSIFTPYLSQNTAASIRINQTKYTNDSIRSRVVIKTEASHNLGALRLFVCLAEDTVFYTGSNGEPRHYNVFRKSYTGATGINVALPAVVGDSLVYSMSSLSNIAWDLSRINTLVILQDETTKEVIQSETTLPLTSAVPTGIGKHPGNSPEGTLLISNESSFTYLKLNFNANNATFNLYDLTGRKLLSRKLALNVEKILIDDLSQGIYLYRIESDKSTETGKLIVTN